MRTGRRTHTYFLGDGEKHPKWTLDQIAFPFNIEKGLNSPQYAQTFKIPS